MNTTSILLTGRPAITSSTTSTTSSSSYSLPLALALLFTMQSQTSTQQSHQSQQHEQQQRQQQQQNYYYRKLSTTPSITSTTGTTSSRPGTPFRTPSTSPRLRPRNHSRISSIDSTAWYGDSSQQQTTPEEFLEAIARRLNTAGKRLERFSGKCAQDVIMALMRPAPMVLLALHPVMLMVLLVVILWWGLGGSLWRS